MRANREAEWKLTKYTVRVLNDVQAGKVDLNPNDTIVIPDTVLPAEGEGYRSEVIVLRTRDWVMQPVNPDGSLRPTLVLSTLGAHVLGLLNPDRYTSTTAVEIVDARVSTEAVTR